MVSFPLPASVHIAPGANPVDASTFQYTEITSDVRLAGGVAIQVGRQDETSEASPTGHALALSNLTGNYSPRNVAGPWYGQLRKGTPVQTRVTLIDDQFGRTVGSGLGTDSVSGQSWSASANWSVTPGTGQVALASAGIATFAILSNVTSDDVDILKVTSLSAVATGAAWIDSTAVRYSDINNYVRLHTEYGTGGVISVKITRRAGGVDTDILATTATSVSYTTGTKISTRIQAVGAVYLIKVWLTSGSPPAAWTASAVDSQTVVRGNAVGLFAWRLATNAGTLTQSIYEYRVDTIRATTSVPEWPTRWNQPITDATAPIAGAGVLRRLTQGAAALHSPMYRQLLLWSPAGFWPLEDGSGATTAASAVAQVAPAVCTDVSFGSAGPPGAANSITLNNATSKIGAVVSNGPGTATGYAGMFMFKLSAIPGADTTLALFNATGTVAQWQVVSAGGGSVKLNGFDASGSTVVAAGPFAWTPADPTQWCAMSLKTSVSGGTVTWTLSWNQVSVPNFAVPSGTYSGSAGKLTGWTATGAAGTSYSMAWLGSNTLPFVAISFYSVESGYAGETAGNRAIRLAAEEGVPLVVMGDPNATAPMGAQTPQTFIDLLTECEQADQGLLVERGAGLGFLTWRWRTNTPVTMALDFAQGHIAAPPEPVDDDLRLINQVILTRTSGSAVTVQNNASIALSGLYTDERTVNVYLDGQLQNEAGWRLHLGTIDELRWPRITLQLHGTPSLIYAWCGMRVGSRLTIVNPPVQVAGNQLDLILEGWTETINEFTWDVEMVCSPAQPWDVGIYGTSLAGSSSTTTGSTLTSSPGSGQSLTLTYTNPGDRWSTTATGYQIVVNGELMTVTAMGAASGTAPTISQVATVTRAAGGVAIAHAIGEAVQVYGVARYAK